MAKSRLKAFEMRHIGEMVNPYGKIAAIGSIGGERYYWMVSWGGAVSMMPAIIVEQIWQSQGKNRRILSPADTTGGGTGHRKGKKQGGGK